MRTILRVMSWHLTVSLPQKLISHTEEQALVCEYEYRRWQSCSNAFFSLEPSDEHLSALTTFFFPNLRVQRAFFVANLLSCCIHCISESIRRMTRIASSTDKRKSGVRMCVRSCECVMDCLYKCCVYTRVVQPACIYQLNTNVAV